MLYMVAKKNSKIPKGQTKSSNQKMIKSMANRKNNERNYRQYNTKD